MVSKTVILDPGGIAGPRVRHQLSTARVHLRRARVRTARARLDPHRKPARSARRGLPALQGLKAQGLGLRLEAEPGLGEEPAFEPKRPP